MILTIKVAWRPCPRLQKKTDAHFLISGLVLIDQFGGALWSESDTLDWYLDLLQNWKETASLHQTLLRGNIAATSSNFFFRREVAEKLHGFRNWQYVHDYDFILRGLEHCGEGLRFLSDDRSLRYRIHARQTIRTNQQAALAERDEVLKAHSDRKNVRFTPINSSPKARPPSFLHRVKGLITHKKKKNPIAHSDTARHVPRHIAIQVDSLDDGGLERVVFNLSFALREEGVGVHLLISGDIAGLLGRELESEGFRVTCLARDHRRLRALIAEEKFELVNLHHSTWGQKIYEANGCPIVYTVHNCYSWLDAVELEKRRRFAKRVRAFIAVSNESKAYFSQFFRVPEYRIEVIPNGVCSKDPHGSSERTHYKTQKGEFVFICVGSITPIKNQNILIAAMGHLTNEFPQAKLLLLGRALDPGYLDYLKQQIAQKGLTTQVRVTGHLPHVEVYAALQSSHCFVLPSLQEGCSNAVLEAMAQGLPMILSDTGSAREMSAIVPGVFVIPNPDSPLPPGSSTEINRRARVPEPSTLEALVNSMRFIMRNTEMCKSAASAGPGIAELAQPRHMALRYLETFSRRLQSP